MPPTPRSPTLGAFGAALATVVLIAGAAPTVPEPLNHGPPASQAVADDLTLTLAAITGWVASDMGLPVPVELPRLAFIDPDRMTETLTEQRRRHAEAGHALRAELGNLAADVVAFYNMQSRTLYLPLGWSAATPVELSLLVHEVVHHLQAVHDQRLPCPAARERQAFDTQARWLAMFGEDLESALGIDRFTLIVATNCLF
jgi:hypothetical protein